MKKLLLILLCVPLIAFSQDCKNKEIKINYTNGLEIFNVCEYNLNINYDEEKEYFWYTSFSKINKTKGGSGGQLLNGNYKFYDEQGNMRMQKSYNLGLMDGDHIWWDSLGNITSRTSYQDGLSVYTKFQNDEGYWIEWENRSFPGNLFGSEGAIKRSYDKYNTLKSKQTFYNMSCYHLITYYSNSQKEMEATMHAFPGTDGNCYGKITWWYRNGNIKIKGTYYSEEECNFYNPLYLTEMKDGVWEWYLEDGELDYSCTYKPEILFWPNGNKKSLGTLIYSASTDTWLQHGKWEYFDDGGIIDFTKQFSWGDEVKEDE